MPWPLPAARRARGASWAVAFIAFSALSASCGRSKPARPSGPPAGPPRAVVSASYTHPDTIILRFSTAVVRIPVRNDGESPLNVWDVASKWECVRLLTSSLSVPPKECRTIDLSYAPDKELGEVRIPVSFKTSDPANPSCSVTVTCRLVQALEVEPAMLQLGAVSPTAKASVKVVNRSPKPVRLLYAAWDDAWLTMEVPKEPIPPGQTGEVRVSIDRGATKGRFSGSGRIVHNLSEVGPLTVSVQGTTR